MVVCFASGSSRRISVARETRADSSSAVDIGFSKMAFIGAISSKHQHPRSRETSRTKLPNLRRATWLDYWSLKFLWMLELGCWSFSARRHQWPVKYFRQSAPPLSGRAIERARFAFFHAASNLPPTRATARPLFPAWNFSAPTVLPRPFFQTHGH